MEKIAHAYGFPYNKCVSNNNMQNFIKKAFGEPGPVISEVCVSKQIFEPKSASRRLEDGTMVSAPLEDLAPFLPRDEFLRNMIIDPVDK
jgi:acetolactate synthase-1/2/3 large subunit